MNTTKTVRIPVPAPTKITKKQVDETLAAGITHAKFKNKGVQKRLKKNQEKVRREQDRREAQHQRLVKARLAAKNTTPPGGGEDVDPRAAVMAQVLDAQQQQANEQLAQAFTGQYVDKDGKILPNATATDIVYDTENRYVGVNSATVLIDEDILLPDNFKEVTNMPMPGLISVADDTAPTMEYVRLPHEDAQDSDEGAGDTRFALDDNVTSGFSWPEELKDEILRHTTLEVRMPHAGEVVPRPMSGVANGIYPVRDGVYSGELIKTKGEILKHIQDDSVRHMYPNKILESSEHMHPGMFEMKNRPDHPLDPLLVKDFTCKLEATTELPKVEITNTQVLVNLYGDETQYKPMPEVGDVLRDDGLVAAVREYGDTPVPTGEELTAVREVNYVFDKLFYAGTAGKITAIEEGSGDNRADVILDPVSHIAPMTFESPQNKSQETHLPSELYDVMLSAMPVDYLPLAHPGSSHDRRMFSNPIPKATDGGGDVAATPGRSREEIFREAESILREHGAKPDDVEPKN